MKKRKKIKLNETNNIILLLKLMIKIISPPYLGEI